MYTLTVRDETVYRKFMDRVAQEGSSVDAVLRELLDTQPQAVDANGWPIGFFDRTYGALADDPIERPPQLPLEKRDPVE